MKNKSFHAASLKSDRLQKIIRALKQAGRRGLSTMTLGRLCNSTRPSSDCSEANQALRKAGQEQFISARYAGRTTNNRKLYIYTLTSLI